MVGLILVGVVVGFLALVICAWIRNPLVHILGRVAALLMVVLEAVLEGIVFVFRGAGRVVSSLLRTLRSVHHDESDEDGVFWDLFVPVLFIAILAILVYSDYKLFSARVGPILFNTASGVKEQSLTGLLGLFFVLSFLVIGFAVSDAYGHVPGGSIIFGLVRDPEHRRVIRNATLVPLFLMLIAALMLGVWTVEKTALHVDDQFTSGGFQVLFACLALIATALSSIPAIIGGLALVIIGVAVFRGLLWTAGMILWVLLSVMQKALDLVIALLDLPARLGASIINAAARSTVVEIPKASEDVSGFITVNPLLGHTPAPAVASETQSAPTVVTEAVPVQAETPSARTASAPVQTAQIQPPRPANREQETRQGSIAGTVIPMPKKFRERPMTSNLDESLDMLPVPEPV